MSDGPEGQTPPPPPSDGTPDAAPPPGAAPQPGAPPAAGTEKKKEGLSTIAWIGIGCGVLIVVMFAGCVAMGAMGLSWLRGRVAEFEADPAMASARIVVQTNPELELVASDDEARTLTVRNRETGETVTVDLQDIQQGRIRFESGDEEITMGFEEGAAEGEGSFAIRKKAGDTQFQVGAGGEENIPEWVPRYPDVAPAGTYFSRSGGEIAGGFTLETEDSLDDVIAFYAEALEDAGFTETSRTTSEVQGSRHASLSAESEGRTVSVVTSSQGAATQVVVTFSGEA